jgi:hypothetical protein
MTLTTHRNRSQFLKGPARYIITKATDPPRTVGPASIMLQKRSRHTSTTDTCAGPSGRALYGVGLLPLACWDCGSESYRGMSVMIVACCQVEVSATGWSLLQGTSTESVASLCVIWKPPVWVSPGPVGVSRAKIKQTYVCNFFNFLRRHLRQISCRSSVTTMKKSWPFIPGMESFLQRPLGGVAIFCVISRTVRQLGNVVLTNRSLSFNTEFDSIP